MVDAQLAPQNPANIVDTIRRLRSRFLYAGCKQSGFGCEIGAEKDHATHGRHVAGLCSPAEPVPPLLTSVQCFGSEQHGPPTLQYGRSDSVLRQDTETVTHRRTDKVLGVLPMAGPAMLGCESVKSPRDHAGPGSSWRSQRSGWWIGSC